MKDLVQIRLPPRYLVLVVLRMNESRDRVSFALLDDVPLDRRHSPMVRLETSGINRLKLNHLVQLTKSTR